MRSRYTFIIILAFFGLSTFAKEKTSASLDQCHKEIGFRADAMATAALLTSIPQFGHSALGSGTSFYSSTVDVYNKKVLACAKSFPLEFEKNASSIGQMHSFLNLETKKVLYLHTSVSPKGFIPHSHARPFPGAETQDAPLVFGPFGYQPFGYGTPYFGVPGGLHGARSGGDADSDAESSTPYRAQDYPSNFNFGLVFPSNPAGATSVLRGGGEDVGNGIDSSKVKSIKE